MALPSIRLPFAATASLTSARVGFFLLLNYIIGCLIWYVTPIPAAFMQRYYEAGIERTLSLTFGLLILIGLFSLIARRPWRHLYNKFWTAGVPYWLGAIFGLAALGTFALVLVTRFLPTDNPEAAAQGLQLMTLAVSMAFAQAIIPLALGRTVFPLAARKVFTAKPVPTIAALRNPPTNRESPPAPARSLWKSGLIAAIAALLMLYLPDILKALDPAKLFGIPMPKSSEPIVGPILFVALVLLVWFIAYPIVSFLRPDAQAVAPSDRANCVVFLRPFGSRRATRVEGPAERALDYRGAFVAIGEPGEWIPKVGALRTYVSNDAWQGVVRNYIQNADTIAIVAGKTPGVRWEFAQIAALGKLDRTIILFPKMSAEDERLTFDALRESLQRPIPDHDRSAGKLAALVFDASGQPVAICAPRLTSSAWELAIYKALDIQSASQAQPVPAAAAPI